jgi:hypothetical protein
VLIAVEELSKPFMHHIGRYSPQAFHFEVILSGELLRRHRGAWWVLKFRYDRLIALFDVNTLTHVRLPSFRRFCLGPSRFCIIVTLH